MPFTGFGGSCATCRKGGKSKSSKQCKGCDSFFWGADATCDDCSGGPKAAPAAPPPPPPGSAAPAAAPAAAASEPAADTSVYDKNDAPGPGDTINSGSLEEDVTLWLEIVSGTTRPPSTSFGEWLQDGQLLCKVANVLSPKCCPKINTSQMPFKRMENITAFIKACRAMGVNEKDVFSTIDLADQKDILTVQRCIENLGKAIKTTRPDFPGPWLGKGAEVKVKDDGKRQVLSHGDVAAGGLLRDVGADLQAGAAGRNNRHM